MADNKTDPKKSSGKIKNEIEIDPNEKLVAEGSKPLTPMQRRKRAMVMRRYRSKIKMAKKRMEKRKASPEKIKSRAKRQAISAMKKKLSGGKSYADMSASEKMMIDKRVAQRKNAIERIAKRLIPKVRQQDMEKFRRKDANLKEEAVDIVEGILRTGGISPESIKYDNGRLEGTPANTKRYLDGTPGQGTLDSIFEERFSR